MTTISMTNVAIADATVDQSNVISILNRLITTCRDGQNGYELAAEGIADVLMKEALQTFAQQRDQFAAELQSEVRVLGGEPQMTGSTVAALHRGWLNIKAAVVGNDMVSILEECEHGEDLAKKSYQEALEEVLPPKVQNLIYRQYREVVNTHDTIRGWRDRTKAANA